MTDAIHPKAIPATHCYLATTQYKALITPSNCAQVFLLR